MSRLDDLITKIRVVQLSVFANPLVRETRSLALIDQILGFQRVRKSRKVLIWRGGTPKQCVILRAKTAFYVRYCALVWVSHAVGSLDDVRFIHGRQNRPDRFIWRRISSQYWTCGCSCTHEVLRSDAVVRRVGDAAALIPWTTRDCLVARSLSDRQHIRSSVRSVVRSAGLVFGHGASARGVSEPRRRSSKTSPHSGCARASSTVRSVVRLR